ncbi:MAG: hypothetical protein ACK4IT_03315 [Thioalkalivibrionaceae bacterium]
MKDDVAPARGVRSSHANASVRDSIVALTVALTRLPGLGERSARRMVRHLLERDRAALSALTQALNQLEASPLKPCEGCRRWSDTPLCPVCLNDQCVGVSSGSALAPDVDGGLSDVTADVEALGEATGKIFGTTDERTALQARGAAGCDEILIVEHEWMLEWWERRAGPLPPAFVLHGQLSPIDRIQPDDIGLPQLESRLAASPPRRVRVVLIDQVTGRLTAQAIAGRMQSAGVDCALEAIWLARDDEEALAEALSRRAV